MTAPDPNTERIADALEELVAIARSKAAARAARALIALARRVEREEEGRRRKEGSKAARPRVVR